MTKSIKEPIPAIFDMCDQLSMAVDTHLSGDKVAAARHFLAADCPVVWEWGGPPSYYVSRNVLVKKPEGDIRKLPGYRRSKSDAPDQEMQAALIHRDGYRCRYCGIPVVPVDVRQLAHHLYPESVRWKNNDYKGQHAGFQALWLQFDHVVPVSHGGSTTLDNMVVSCGLCNFGKWNYTLLQLGLEDPRLRPPEPIAWDGLSRFIQSRFRSTFDLQTGQKVIASRLETVPSTKVTPESAAHLPTFFLPWAWISKGYIYTPPIEGRSRWFRIGAAISGEGGERDGRTGVLIRCAAQALTKRGIKAGLYLA